MISQISKRDGEIVNYDPNKIINAIVKASEEVDEDISDSDLSSILNTVEDELLACDDVITVEFIQDRVEEALLEHNKFKVARAYITYREQRKHVRTRDMFKKRVAMKPYEYPEFMQYADAIRHSYWVHTEFNFTSDIQDYHTRVKPHEKKAITNSMLAIAQVEVAVKTFWGDLYHRMPKYELGAVGAVFSESECYIEGTEILTPSGWVDFRDIKNGDLVAQFNHDNTIQFVPCRNKIVKDVDGKLHHISKKHIDAYITPNHNMVMYRGKDAERFDLIPSSELSGRNNKLFIPQAGKLTTGSKDKLTDKERLYVALQADGNFRYWRNSRGERIPRGASSNKQTYEITFKKERKKQRFNNIVKNLDDVRVSEYNVTRKDYAIYSVDVDKDNNYKSFDWVDLSDKTWEWCEDFIQELAEWDGCRMDYKKHGKISYSTTDKAVADKVQAIATMAGYRVVINKYEDKRSEKFNDCYNMVFVSNKERITATYNKEEVDYNGKVYCVEVDSGAIVTRYNDKVLISGNCRHAEAYSHLLEILGLNNAFDSLLEIPALRDRVEYLSKSVSWAKTGDDRDYVLSVILFSLFIEHVSLFSQFSIMMAFNKHKNYLSGLSNVIEATSKEEQIHGLFGIDIVNTLREERPEWFDDKMEQAIIEACKDSFEAEKKVVDWIFEDGELDFLSKASVLEFIKNRMNNSLESIGYERLFEVDTELVKENDWFDDEVTGTKLTDFFNKRSVNYTKFSNSITADTLFSPLSDLVQTPKKQKVNEVLRTRMIQL